MSRYVRISSKHVGVVCVALDHYLRVLAERAQGALASQIALDSDLQMFTDTRELWDSATAARREALS